jgi:hypothetical protein
MLMEADYAKYFRILAILSAIGIRKIASERLITGRLRVVVLRVRPLSLFRCRKI